MKIRSKKSLLLFINTFFFITIVSLVLTFIFINFIELQLNEKIGSGLFYLKGYYETNETIVTEQGIGVITLPLTIGLFVAFATIGVKYINDKRKSIKKVYKS